VLRRGYAVLTRLDDGKIVKDAAQAPTGVELLARLAQGTLNVKVQESLTQET
jgi:exonuclease VII large subunit